MERYRCETGDRAKCVCVYESSDNKATLEPWSETAVWIEHGENGKPQVTGNKCIHVHTTDTQGQSLKVIFNPFSHPCSWSAY